MQVELTVEQRQAQAEQRAAMRRDALQKEVNRFVGKGYRVVSQSEYAAQMVKPKVFSRLWAFLWFLCFGVGLLVYLFWYAAKRDKQVYLTVDDQAKVHRR